MIRLRDSHSEHHHNAEILFTLTDKVRLQRAMEMERANCRPKEIAESLGFVSDATYLRWRNHQSAKIKLK